MKWATTTKKNPIFEYDLDNENKKIEREVVNAIVENRNLPIWIEKKFKNKMFRQKRKLRKIRKKLVRDF